MKNPRKYIYLTGILLLVINFSIIPWKFSTISSKSGSEIKRFDAGYSLFFSPPIIPLNEITLFNSAYPHTAMFRGSLVSKTSVRINGERLAIQTIVVFLIFCFYAVAAGRGYGFRKCQSKNPA